MLETLRIQNYALIDDVEVTFRPGFNVLTGETGAGKSIIVGALNLVLGARASSDAVRDGAERATISAVFRIDRPGARLSELLAQHELGAGDGELILSRTISADGRSRAYVGGTIVPLGVLSDIGDELVDLHGQHEHQSLLKTERQLEVLDAYAGLETARAEVAKLVAALRAMEREIAELETDDRERARQLDFLRHEVSEIRKAGLRAGEEEELADRQRLITNAEKIAEAAVRAYGLLYENDTGAAVDTVSQAAREMETLADVDARFAAMAESLHGLRAQVEDVASELRAYTRELDFDPAELEQLNARLALIGGLKRKYGDSISAILAYAEKAEADIARFDQRDERLARLQGDVEKARGQALEAARELSRKRVAAAKKLDKQITGALRDLGMTGGQFETRFEAGELTARGVDQVAFYLAANPGEKPKPLRQVASGGEVSRIMLALKAVFAEADAIPALIFDEIDAGVGGVVANKVAQKLRSLAATHQTICITHLPQIAAAAQTHYFVAKDTKKGRTTASVTRVENERRVEELARLLDGSVSEVSLEHARALLRGR